MVNIMAKRQRLRVILVNFRTPELTIRSVGSIRERGIAKAENITVVENCSGDDSMRLMQTAMPDIEIKASLVNGGFGAGVNFGAAGIDADYLLILNPDTYFEMDSVTPGVHPQGETRKIADSLLSSMPPFQCRRGKNASVRIPRE